MANGFAALFSNTTGSSNIGLGYLAGYNITTGGNDIDIGNTGINESNAIRIGNPRAQTAAFIAGIFGKTVNANGVPVLVDNTGKLGVMVSSARYSTLTSQHARNSYHPAPRLLVLGGFCS